LLQHSQALRDQHAEYRITHHDPNVGTCRVESSRPDHFQLPSSGDAALPISLGMVLRRVGGIMTRNAWVILAIVALLLLAVVAVRLPPLIPSSGGPTESLQQ
jgi:hypothetical protein